MRNSMAKRMPKPARLAIGVGGAAGAALLAAACSSGSSSSAAGGASPAAAPASSSGSSSTVITTASSSGNMFLTDGGRAVYLWTKDGSGMSACSSACAGVWPPVPATGTVTASGGATASDLGTITRSDGTKQVTYKGHPLYFYSGDSGSGMASGQGSDQFGAKWWLVSPSGSDVSAAVSSFTSGSGGGSAPSAPAPASSPSSSSAGGGWS